jgi:transposase
LKIFAARSDGRDPAAEKQQTRRRLVADRVDDLIELFIREHVSANRSAGEISRLLRREVTAVWGRRSIHEISKRNVIDLVMEVAARALKRGDCGAQARVEAGEVRVLTYRRKAVFPIRYE